MDCGTCEVASPVQLQTPEVVNVDLTITDTAKLMLAESFGEDKDMALLVGVLSGGCLVGVYDLQIVEEALDVKNYSLRVSKFGSQCTSHLLTGIEIDYVDKLMGGGFKINNPNAKSSCGCGESFG